MDISWRYPDAEHRQKPPVPDLPKTDEELRALLKKGFTVLCETRPVSILGGEYHPGGVAITKVELKCPFCGKEFEAIRKSGCFMRDLSPNSCPNCSFPNNISKELYKIERKGENKEENHIEPSSD